MRELRGVYAPWGRHPRYYGLDRGPFQVNQWFCRKSSRMVWKYQAIDLNLKKCYYIYVCTYMEMEVFFLELRLLYLKNMKLEMRFNNFQ